jgi:hypothetical protein
VTKFRSPNRSPNFCVKKLKTKAFSVRTKFRSPNFLDHDGFVPEEIFWGARTQLENDELLLQWTNNRHSDITQYPVLPFALRAIYDATGDAAFIVEFLPQLVRYLQWWRRARDDGDGLVVKSGMPREE